jgi:hypothetical protein
MHAVLTPFILSTSGAARNSDCRFEDDRQEFVCIAIVATGLRDMWRAEFSVRRMYILRFAFGT